MKRNFLRGLAAAFFLFCVSPAFAQGAVVELHGFYEIVQPYLLALVSVLATAIVGWLAELLRRKFSLDIDAAHRDALQTALANGAGLVLTRIGGSLVGKKVDLKHALIADSVNYVLQAVPDAIRHFRITPESVAEKILAKLSPQKPV
jgi:uncharacterized membrane protein